MAVAENTGYPTGWFKHQDIARKLYECAICLEVVKDAMQLRDCGHLFCRCCIEKVFKLQGQCPTCRNEISEEIIFPDKNANRAIGKLDVNCPSTGCEWDGTLNSLLQEHNARCPFFVLNCSNVGCDMQVIRQELEIHLTKCENRTVVCEHCKMEHVFKDKDEHLSMCHLLPVECENKCSEKNIPCNEMKEHLDTVCSQTVIKCKYSEFGCEYECKRQEMEEHLNQATKEHLELHTLQISGLKEKLEIDKNEIKEWKTKLEIDKNEIKEWKTKHENDIKQLQSKHQQDVEELKQQINQILVMSNCTGTYTLKISDFENKLREAKSSLHIGNRIQGKPFFTSCNGYKMRLFIYLDEGEQGLAGYMGVYLVLMRSDHDETLHWPFNKKCTFSVIDQQDGEYFKEDHVLAATPKGEDGFKRPQQDENRGQGFNKFILHSKLRTRKYIEDNTVCIKVQIEP